MIVHYVIFRLKLLKYHPTPSSTMACTRAQVIGSYRKLIRAGYFAFRDNYLTFADYRNAVRAEFHLQADETDPEIIEKLVKRAEQMAHEVQTRIVPLEQVDETKYRVSFEERHFDDQK